MLSQNKGINSEKTWTTKKILIFVSLFSLIIFTGFLLYGILKEGLGFPLDDAWIHQVYARNLMKTGNWSFIPGIISGGSTAPLWTLLLSIGHLLPNNGFYIWTFLVEMFCYVNLIVWSSKIIISQVSNQNWKITAIIAVLMGMEWHLLWGAVSGMETIFYCLGIVIIFYFISETEINWFKIGLVNSLLFWIRPDGLTLFGPIALVILAKAIQQKKINKNITSYFITMIISLIGYMIFNFATTGNLFPNTYYAKQMEYAELLKTPLLSRLMQEILPIISGIGLLILPGFFFQVWKSIKEKDFPFIAFSLWTTGYVLLYAIRLPVTYQYGRYVMPVIPIFLIIGFIGLMNIINRIKINKTKQLVTFVWLGSIFIVGFIYLLLGVKAYQQDLYAMKQLMVEPAAWVERNTKQDDVIAVHDIGAMGYFSDRKLIDLAGLVNPEVIPFIRNSCEIKAYINSSDAKYFVGFNDWYQGSDSWGKIVESFSINYNDEKKSVYIIEMTK